jgi:two-component system sensor histidine kinase/response regulator
MLVVDDNDDAREVLESMLRSMTFEVTSVASGPAALVELDTAEKVGHPYDLAFLDWKMPIMDGVDTASHISSMTFGRRPHLLMLTGYGREDVLESAGKAGIEDVLVKPVTPSQLFDTVVKIFSIEGDLPDPGTAVRVPRSPVALPKNPAAIAGARILLVEDNELNQEIGIELLKDLGMEVELAEDGSVALEMLQRRSYDLVLMDMQMPVMDGITATREIRRNPDLASLPIVAMTANAMSVDRDACLAAGMNDHLAKPIDQERLVAALLRWIRPPKAQKTPAISAESARDQPGKGAEASDPARPADLQTCLAKIPGLDSRKGIEMVMNREDLYRRLLGKYLEGQAMAPDKIATALAAGDRKLAQLTAHSLKGTSAQVCASGIRMQAEAIEHAIRDGMPAEDLVASVAGLSAAMQILVKEISACLG